MEGKAVCDGYAWTAKLMLAIAGIESEVITGWGIPQTEEANEERPIYHAWNLVKIDDKYYHLDITWDENIYEETGMMSYRFFNLSSSLISNDHKWDKGYYKKANSTKYNFYAGLYLAERDENTIYYSNYDDDDTLHKVSIEGKEDQKLGDVPCSSIKIKDGYVEFISNDGNKYKIEK